MGWLTIILFALALNIDSFSVGLTYGLRRIRLPLAAIVLISIISALAIAISMHLGNLVASYVSNSFAHQLGGFLLLALGIWVFYQGVKSSRQKRIFPPQIPKDQIQSTAQPVVYLKINLGGLIIQILRQPQCADLDDSGDISYTEALILGIALAIDSFSAGFAVSMLGFSLLFTVLAVGLGHLLLVYFGLWLGKLFGASKFQTLLTYLPGCILIGLGLIKLI